MVEGATAEEPSADADDRRPLPELFGELIEDGRAWLNAEVAVYRAEARRRLIIAAIGIGLMTLAATLTAGTLIALLVGAMFALTPVLGSGWAIATVVAVALAIATVAALAGRHQFRRLTRGKKSDEGNTRTQAGA